MKISQKFMLPELPDALTEDEFRNGSKKKNWLPINSKKMNEPLYSPHSAIRQPRKMIKVRFFPLEGTKRQNTKTTEFARRLWSEMGRCAKKMHRSRYNRMSTRKEKLL